MTAPKPPEPALIAEYVAIELRHEDGTWWCDSPQIPGFYGADDTKQGLIDRCRTAIEEILAEDGKRLGTFVWQHAQFDGADDER